jgi:D-serine deaminase-like pyridoxal phosphate-dependent protein
MTFPAKGRRAQAEAWLAEAKAMLETAGLTCPTISSGGTPDLYRGTADSVVTEYRPGTYIYNDRMQVSAGSADWDECALTVLATVVSRPTPSRAVLDAGSKSLSSDTGGLEGFGRIIGYEDATIRSLSEEHGVVELAAPSDFPRIGERVKIVPNHVCVVVNLFDVIHLLAADGGIETVPVAARGRVQ